MSQVEQKPGDTGKVQAAGRGRRAALTTTMSRRPENRMEIRLPEYYVLRLVARSLLALILISFSVLSLSPGSVFSTATAVAAATNGVLSRQADGDSFLPALFRDLNRRGLLHPGDRAMFLSHRGGSVLARLIKQNKMELVIGCSGGCRGRRSQGLIPDGSLDFVFSGIGFSDEEFFDRVLKVGGVAVVRLSSKRAVPYRMPSNFRIVYIGKFHSTVVAMKKEIDSSRQTAAPSWRQRRLLALPETIKEEALDMLEDILHEPPRTYLLGRKSQESYVRRRRFLPDLNGYARRIFIEVVPNFSHRRSGGERSAARWFPDNYPTRKFPFNILRIKLKEEDDTGEEEDDSEISAWLMKTDAATEDAMLRSGAAGLVDELFLDCGGGWENTGRLRRPYWEYLSLSTVSSVTPALLSAGGGGAEHHS